MSLEPLGRPRSRVESVPGGLRVVIPSRKQVFVLLFLPVWLVGWAFGLVVALEALLRLGPSAVPGLLVVWLTFWTLGGAWALYTFLYTLAGREVIEVAGGILRARREVLGLGRTREYAASEVRRLRASPAPVGEMEALFASASYFRAKGPLTFDYGATTVRLGAGLDEAEAAMLAERLAGYLPAGAR